MTLRFGWWEYDPSVPGLVNLSTGERVVYRGVLGSHMRVTWSESWLRYDYIHSDLTFPLVARTRKADDGVASRGRRSCLCIDYPRSARLWRDDPFGNRVIGTAPAYGVWRRIDDCLVDAFTCWPRGAIGGWDGDTVELFGGWLNGAWRPDFSRLSVGGREIESALAGVSASDAAPPHLVDLGATPAPRWYRPEPGDGLLATGAKAMDEAEDGARMPLLLTSDGRYGIFGPEHQTSNADGGVFSLVDRENDTSTTFVAEWLSGKQAWLVHLAWPTLEATEGEVSAIGDWRQRSWSVVDAFAAWHASRRGIGSFEALPPNGIILSNCYRGGILVPGSRCHIRYAV